MTVLPLYMYGPISLKTLLCGRGRRAPLGEIAVVYAFRDGRKALRDARPGLAAVQAAEDLAVGGSAEEAVAAGPRHETRRLEIAAQRTQQLAPDLGPRAAAVGALDDGRSGIARTAP